MPSSRRKGGFYAVNKGRRVGVFATWEECEEQIKGYPGARHKKFPTITEAETFAFADSIPASLPTSVTVFPTHLVRPQSRRRFEEICLALATPPSTSRSDSTTSPPTSAPSISISSFASSSPEPESSTPASSTVLSLPSSWSSPTSPIPRHRVRLTSSTPTTLEPVEWSRSSPFNPAIPGPRFSEDGPLSQFFSQFPSFTPNLEKNAPTSEFHRMCRSNKNIKQEQVDEFKDALSQEFNSIYGTDVNCLGSWQAICVRIGVTPVPDRLEDCRELVMNIHVNLVDLTTPKGKIRIFDSSKELSDYTKETKKFFPKDTLSAGELLRYLLRHIFNPALDDGRDRHNVTWNKENRGNKAKEGLMPGNRRQRGRGRFAPY